MTIFYIQTLHKALFMYKKKKYVGTQLNASRLNYTLQYTYMWLLIAGNFRSIGLPANISSSLAKTLSTVPDFLLSETCYAYCQQSITRVPKYRNTFIVEESFSLVLMCAEATAYVKVCRIRTVDNMYRGAGEGNIDD